jgi:nitrile hydratase accessory protein
LTAPPQIPGSFGLESGLEAPVFDQPWQAQIFAIAVRLSERGHFTWAEWTQALGREIARAGDAGRDDYYLCWLAALEKLVAEKNLLGKTELTRRKTAWDRAARATPHGKPIVL